MKLSVVIPVHNGSGVIGECLESLAAGAGIQGNVEIIVVDDASTDGTADIVRRFPVRYLRIEKSGAAGARNAGIAAATGEVIVLFDADVIVCEDTLRRMTAHLGQDPDAFVVQGRWDPQSPAETFAPKFFLARYHYNFKGLFRGTSRLPVANLETGCVAIRREVFEEVGVFDTRYRRAGGEEHELGLRILSRFPIYYYDDIFVQHRFGGFMPTLHKMFFRTVNFAMLLFRTGARGLLALHGPSVSREDRNSVILLAAALCVSVLLPFRPGVAIPAISLLAVLYLINIGGFLRFVYRKHGTLFAVWSIAADAAIMVPRLAGIAAALYHYYLRGELEYRI